MYGRPPRVRLGFVTVVDTRNVDSAAEDRRQLRLSVTRCKHAAGVFWTSGGSDTISIFDGVRNEPKFIGNARPY